MSKVFSIHQVEIKPGASVEALEQLITTNPFRTLPGWKAYIAKGDRGERTGRYVLIHEFDSLEIRNRYFPAEGGQPSQEVEQLFNSPELQALGSQWDALATPLTETIYTDYVVFG